MNKENLIREVYQKVPIWDQHHKSHYNRYVLSRHWTDIAGKCDVTVAEAKKAWKILRQQFKGHFEKLPDPKSGNTSAPEDDVEWPYFQSLLFLKDVFKKKITNENSVHDMDPEPEDEEICNSEDNTQSNDGCEVSLSPAPSSNSLNIGSYSASTSGAPFPGLFPADPNEASNLGYRKRPHSSDSIGNALLELEKENMKIRKEIETSELDEKDEDVAFFTSLLPHVKKLPPVNKIMFRIKVQQVLMDNVYGGKNLEGKSSVPPHNQPQQPSSSWQSSLELAKVKKSGNFSEGNSNWYMDKKPNSFTRFEEPFAHKNYLISAPEDSNLMVTEYSGENSEEIDVKVEALEWQETEMDNSAAKKTDTATNVLNGNESISTNYHERKTEDCGSQNLQNFHTKKFKSLNSESRKHQNSFSTTSTVGGDDSLDIFGKSVSSQLKLLPKRQAITTQLKIQTVLTEQLLAYEDLKETRCTPPL